MSHENIGFIIDTPNALIKSKKGDLLIDKSSTGEVTFTGTDININGGWSFLDLAKIPKSTAIAVKITNAEFNLDQLALTSGGSVTVGAKVFTKFGDIYTVDASNTITIPDVINANSLRINGFTETTGAVTTGQFKVTIGASSTLVQFYTDVPSGTTLKPSYDITTGANVSGLSVKTTDVPGSAEVILTWPIYESEDVESGIWAYGQITLYKAKIDQNNKIGGAYKAASNFDINFSTLDPRRPDKKAWDFVILPVAAADTTPPTIVSVSPTNAATGVVATAPIIFTFSEAINPANVNSANFIITNSTDGSNPSGSLTLSANNTVVTFTPGAALATGVKYFATVTSDVTDTSGNKLAANQTTSFTIA